MSVQKCEKCHTNIALIKVPFEGEAKSFCMQCMLGSGLSETIKLASEGANVIREAMGDFEKQKEKKSENVNKTKENHNVILQVEKSILSLQMEKLEAVERDDLDSAKKSKEKLDNLVFELETLINKYK